MAVRRLAEVQPDSFDFTPENRAWVDRQIKKYPPGRQASAVMPLLRRAQVQHGGWLPKPAIEKVAEILEMPEIRVLEVATFYTMYNLAPVGRFFIQFCGTTPCVLRGADGIKAVLEQRIGAQNHVTEDGNFAWLEVECLGACCNAPMVQINDDYYEDLTPESFSALLDDLAAGRSVRTGSQTGRRTSEPANGLTSLTSFYGADGKGDTFEAAVVADDAHVLAAANDDPAFDASIKAHEAEGDAPHAEPSQEPSGDGSSHETNAGEPSHSYARQGGSIAGTGRRTDDPVGTEQTESGAVHKLTPEGARDRQGQSQATPNPSTSDRPEEKRDA